MSNRPATRPLEVSVVIPVYRGEDTLPALLDELSALTDPQLTPDGRASRVGEVLLEFVELGGDPVGSLGIGLVELGGEVGEGLVGAVREGDRLLHLEVEVHMAVADAAVVFDRHEVEEAGELVGAPDLVLELHAVVTEDTLDEAHSAGRMQTPTDLRVKVRDEQTGEILHDPPPADQLPDRLRLMCDFAYGTVEAQGYLHPIVKAIVLHFWLAHDHPFADGNGRIARALTDMALAQNDGQRIRYYSLSSQIMAQRKSYYDVLERCQKGNGDITGWLAWFLDCFCKAIERSETLLATVLDRTHFWKMHDQNFISERQRKIINRMLDEGRGGFVGGMTTRKYVSLADVSRATAFREINYLVEIGMLKLNPGRGRNASYDLNWDEMK